MDDNKIFRAIWRFNAVAIALGVVLVAILALIALTDMATRALWREATNVAKPAADTDTTIPDDVKLSLGRLSWIQKGSVLWAPVHSAQTFRYGVSSKTASSTRNYIFFDVQTGASRPLLPDNRSIITDTEVVKLERRGEPSKAVALAIAIVSRDTNGDGRLSANDTADVALVKSDGSNLTRLPVQGRLRSARLVDQDRVLLVIETTNADVEGVMADVETFKVKRRFPVWRSPQ